MIKSTLVNSDGRLGWRFAVLSNPLYFRRSYAEAKESLGMMLRFGKTGFAIRMAEETKRLAAVSRQGTRC